jgi:hypothetical protein
MSDVPGTMLTPSKLMFIPHQFKEIGPVSPILQMRSKNWLGLTCRGHAANKVEVERQCRCVWCQIPFSQSLCYALLPDVQLCCESSCVPQLSPVVGLGWKYSGFIWLTPGVASHSDSVSQQTAAADTCSYIRRRAKGSFLLWPHSLVLTLTGSCFAFMCWITGAQTSH